MLACVIRSANVKPTSYDATVSTSLVVRFSIRERVLTSVPDPSSAKILASLHGTTTTIADTVGLLSLPVENNKMS
jgi:hypothetical protein